MPDDAPTGLSELGGPTHGGLLTSDYYHLILDTFKGAVWDLKARHVELQKMVFAKLAFKCILNGYSWG
jgi:hypothetical protein